MEKPCELLETLLSIRGKKEDNQQLSSIKKKIEKVQRLSKAYFQKKYLKY